MHVTTYPLNWLYIMAILGRQFLSMPLFNAWSYLFFCILDYFRKAIKICNLHNFVLTSLSHFGLGLFVGVDIFRSLFRYGQ